MKNKSWHKLFVLLLLAAIMLLVVIKYTIPQKKNIARGLVFQGWQLTNLGMPKAAVFVYSIALSIDSNNYQAYVFRGDAYLKTGNYDYAMRDYLLTFSLEPGDEHAITSLNILYIKMYGYKKANDLCEILMRIYPKKKDICYTQIGHNYFLMKDYQKALTSFSMVKNPGMCNIYQYRLFVYTAINEFDLALRDCEMAIKIDPRSNSYLNELVQIIHKDKEKYGQNLLLIDALEESLITNPTDFNISNQLADTYKEIGEYEKSVGCYSSIIIASTDRINLSNAYFGRACVYYNNLNDTAKAMDDMRRALSLGCDEAEKWLNKHE